MQRRAIPVLLVAAAALADLAGVHRLAFYALLAAVPAVAVAGLVCLGEIIDLRREGLGDTVPSIEGLLWVVALVLILAGEAARGQALTTGTVPTLGASAVFGCLIVFLVQGLVVVGSQVRSRRLSGPGASPALRAR